MSYRHLPKQAQLFLNEYEEILASFDWMQDILNKLEKSARAEYDGNVTYVKINKELFKELLEEIDILSEGLNDAVIIFD